MRRGDSDPEFYSEEQDLDRQVTNVQPVSFHQPNLNYTYNPCYQPNGIELHNTDEPYVILNLHKR